ncbi:MAG: glycosyltransferase family 4 protein [Pleurocapsa sp.]
MKNQYISHSKTARNDASLKVTFLSNLWNFNPYQELLIKSFESENIKVNSVIAKLFFLPTILQQKPNIVHIQFLQYFLASRNTIYGWLKFALFITQIVCLRCLGTKTVWTVHEWEDKVSKKGSHNISPLKCRIIGKVLAGIVTHCDSSNAQIVQELQLDRTNKTKVFTIPHANYIGAYTNNISREDARRQLGIALEESVLLYFGSIHRNKGVIEAIAAFQKIDKPSIKFIVAGKPSVPIRASILELAADCPNLMFIDPPEHIPDDEVQLYMNASDVVVLPYKVFATSGVALLAMSFKKACIAPNLGFFKDIFDNKGAFLYNPMAQDGLLLAMEQAIAQSQQLAEMGAYNFTVAEQWSWDYVASQTLKVYFSCLQKTYSTVDGE